MVINKNLSSLQKKQLKAFNKILDEKSIAKALKSASEEIAKGYRRLLISNIKTNKFKFRLAASTINSRVLRGRSTTPLVDSGSYVRSIIIKDKTEVTVRQGKHPSGLTYEELTFILEYGRRDKGVRSFPVWRKTWEEFKPTAAQIFVKHLTKQFKI